MRSAAILSCLLAGSALLACAGRATMRGVHPAGLSQATQSVAIAFHQHDIPVQVADEMVGYVASGGFQVEGVWGPERVERRVDCGVTTDGTPRARLGPVWLSVRAELRPSTDALATARAGASVHRRPTEVQLTASGEVTSGEETHGCALTEDFSREIMRSAGIMDDGILDLPGDLRSVADEGR